MKRTFRHFELSLWADAGGSALRGDRVCRVVVGAVPEKGECVEDGFW